MARYVGGDTLLITRKSSLYAVRFDPDTLEVSGTPGVVLQSIAGDATTGAMNVSHSATGTLAYVSGRADALRPAPTPPEGELPDDRALTLRVAAAASELAQLRNQAAHRVSGELQAAHAYRTAAR